VTSSDDVPSPDKRQPRPTWSDRVAVSPVGDGFAYVPGHVLVRGAAAEDRARELTGRDIDRPLAENDGSAAAWARVARVEDPLEVVALLRAEGLQAQPEHVFFAHGCGPGCPPHPSLAYELASGAFGADPYRANPYRANPYRANPYRANPYRANPYRANGSPMSTATPADGRAFAVRSLQGAGRHPRVVVLDTGLAGGVENGVANPDHQRPALLDTGPAPERITGTLDRADTTIVSTTGTAFPPDGCLDPVAGHGTFIAGIVEQLAPGGPIRVVQVIEPLGDGRELDIVAAILAEVARPAAERPDIISMSFGGQVMESAFAMRTAIAEATLAGIVVVASAGNEGTCIPQYPAAFDQVIGVGAVGPDGPPPWTNYGDWVDACAPGVDLVSAFFASFDGLFPAMNTVDPDRFAAWATWSGTSFSTPVVVAALAREMVQGDCSAQEAVERVVRAPHLMRIPCLGTVINL
jgi:hypothetical protein